MEKIPQQTYSIKHTTLFTIISTVFFVMFAVLYAPTFGSDEATMETWRQNSDFCIAILCAISFAVIALSRAIMIFSTRGNRITELEYFIWQLCELIVLSLFADLFISLYFHQSYFLLLPRIFAIVVAVAIYPYTIYWLYLERRQSELMLGQAEETIRRLQQGLDSLTPGTINFPDENGAIKLAVGADRVISIESAGNYVTILYDDGGKLARFALRNSLKNIESICQDNDLIRCHRSFFVNIKRIKLLRKDPTGIFAEIDYPGIEDIPISKTYSSQVMHLFSSR